MGTTPNKYVFILMVITGVLSAALADVTRPGPKTVTRIVEHTDPNCHPRLVRYDLDVLRRAYALEHQGHSRQAFNYLGWHFKAIAKDECL